MQTAEGYVVGMFGPCERSHYHYDGCSVHESVWETGERCRWMRNFADLVRERDAELAAEVAVETLRKVAGELNNPAATPEVESVTRAITYIYDEADRIEREAGESNADT